MSAAFSGRRVIPTMGMRRAAITDVYMLLQVIEAGDFYEDYDESMALLGKAKAAFGVLCDLALAAPESPALPLDGGET